MDGRQVVEGLRGWTTVPLVVLSARQGSQAKFLALDAGADDYVTKPFSMDELLARLHAAVRRAVPAGQAPVVHAPDFLVDLARKQVVLSAERGGDVVHLTPTEWHLLDVLGRNAGRLVGQRELLQQIWGAGYKKETHYLRLYLAQLRRKVEPGPSSPWNLLTEPGLGYRLLEREND